MKKKKKKKKKVKLVTRVEGDPKALFSIATTLRCREGTTPFPWLLKFTLDPYLIMLSVKQGGIKYYFFESLVWLLGIEPWTLVNTNCKANGPNRKNIKVHILLVFCFINNRYNQKA